MEDAEEEEAGSAEPRDRPCHVLLQLTTWEMK